MPSHPRAATSVGRALLVTVVLAGGAALRGEPVTVRHAEGLVHGFLVLRSAEGSPIADGDLIQLARGTRVTAQLRFRFRDGSLHDETTVFSQRGRFRLISNHLVQRGASFPQPLDMRIDAAGRVAVRYTDDKGEAKEERERFDLPDLANGLVPTLLKNIDPKAPAKSVSFIAATPKPRLVKLEIQAIGEDRFTTAGAARAATHYVLKVNLGGLTGLVAPLVGKQPPDSHVWILGGEAPAFVRADQPFFAGGPIWRIELVSPAWAARVRDRFSVMGSGDLVDD